MKTMKSMSETEYDKSKIEFVIIDDASDEPHLIDDIKDLFPYLNIVFKRIEPHEKNWGTRCPVPSLNMGIEMCSNEYFLINGAEMMHVGDIISDFANRVEDNNYVCYATWHLREDASKNKSYEALKQSYPYEFRDLLGSPQAYQHSRENNRLLMFCAGMSRSAMNKVGPFDEQYKFDIGFADTEWVHRLKKTDIEIVTVDEPCAFHQWHPRIQKIPNGFKEKRIPRRLK